jgi:hypothetical protein
MGETIGDAQRDAREERRGLRDIRGLKNDSGDLVRERAMDQRRIFEAKKGGAGHDAETVGDDSIASDAMLRANKVSKEAWVGDPESERHSFIQEELYVHAKVGRPRYASVLRLLIFNSSLLLMTGLLSAEALI